MLEQNLFAGFGGQGMLLIGSLLATAGMKEGKYVSWLPSYGPEMRGGTANCSVVLSDAPISSPVITEATCVIAMNRPSLEKFESSLRSGGILIVNSSLVDIKAARRDIEAFYIPANEEAEKAGSAKAANLVVLGACIGKTGCVSPESVIEAMIEKLGGKKAGLAEINKRALNAGIAMVRS